jgi:hypothetical protein
LLGNSAAITHDSKYSTATNWYNNNSASITNNATTKQQQWIGVFGGFPVEKPVKGISRVCSIGAVAGALGEFGNQEEREISGFHGGDYEEWCLLGCYAAWLL